MTVREEWLKRVQEMRLTGQGGKGRWVPLGDDEETFVWVPAPKGRLLLMAVGEG